MRKIFLLMLLVVYSGCCAKPTDKPKRASMRPSRVKFYARKSGESKRIPRKFHRYPFSYRGTPRTMEVVATAYSLKEGSGTGRTSTGTIPEQGRTVAVDPRVIPYGSKIFIPSLGWRIAEDCGGAIRDKRIDIYFRRDRDAIEFGRRRMKIFVYDRK